MLQAADEVEGVHGLAEHAADVTPLGLRRLAQPALEAPLRSRRWTSGFALALVSQAEPRRIETMYALSPRRTARTHFGRGRPVLRPTVVSTPSLLAGAC